VATGDVGNGIPIMLAIAAAIEFVDSVDVIEILGGFADCIDVSAGWEPTFAVETAEFCFGTDVFEGNIWNT
jgi:hypothetical protein